MIQINSFPLPRMKFLTAQLRLQDQNKSTSSFSRQSHTHTEDASTLFKCRRNPFWVFLQASRAEFVPVVFLAGGVKTRLLWATNTKLSRQAHTCTFIKKRRVLFKAWGNNVTSPTRILGNNPNNKSRSQAINFDLYCGLFSCHVISIGFTVPTISWKECPSIYKDIMQARKVTAAVRNAFEM